MPSRPATNRTRQRRWIGRRFGRQDNIVAGAKAIVVDVLGYSVAVGVELGPDVAERVPLGRVLGPEQNRVVADHVAPARIFLAQCVVVVA